MLLNSTKKEKKKEKVIAWLAAANMLKLKSKRCVFVLKAVRNMLDFII